MTPPSVRARALGRSRSSSSSQGTGIEPSQLFADRRRHGGRIALADDRRRGQPAARAGLPGAVRSPPSRPSSPVARSSSSSACPRGRGASGARPGARARRAAGRDRHGDGRCGRRPAAGAEPDEPLPPHHQEAYDAIAPATTPPPSRSTRPRSRRTRATSSPSPGSRRSRCLRASKAPTRPRFASRGRAPRRRRRQLAVADLDVSGGHLDDAFGRLLDAVPAPWTPRQERACAPA